RPAGDDGAQSDGEEGDRADAGGARPGARGREPHPTRTGVTVRLDVDAQQLERVDDAVVLRQPRVRVAAEDVAGAEARLPLLDLRAQLVGDVLLVQRVAVAQRGGVGELVRDGADEVGAPDGPRGDLHHLLLRDGLAEE